MNTTHARQPAPTPFDTWAVTDLLLLHWRKIAAWTLVGAVAGALIARAVWSRSFSSTAQLIHYEASSIDDSYRPRPLGAQTLVVMLQSPGLFEEVGAHLQQPVTAKELADVLAINLDRNNDVVTVTATGHSRAEAVDIVNRFCAAAVAYTQTIQRQEAIEAGDNVNRQLGQVESEIESTYKVIPAASETAVASVAAEPEQAAGPASDLPQRIQHAREKLNDLLMRYTDAHPLVIEQRMRLASLQAEESHRCSRAAPGAGLGLCREPAHARGGRDRRAPADP
jgi:capsular polysaccharide biosynthesis protein